MQNDHVSIKDVAKRISETMGPAFAKTAQDIGALNLAESSYTAVTVPLAIAYTEASAFFIQDMKSKNDRLAEIEYEVTTVAGNWRQAGEASTVTTV